MSDYGLSLVLRGDIEDIISRISASLTKRGFGILSTIDMRESLYDRIGAKIAPYVILGACNAILAEKALAVEPSIGLMLPCNVVVRGLTEGEYLVEIVDPELLVAATGNPDLSPIAEEAAMLLAASLDDLRAAAGSESASEPATS